MKNHYIAPDSELLSTNLQQVLCLSSGQGIGEEYVIGGEFEGMEEWY